MNKFKLEGNITYEFLPDETNNLIKEFMKLEVSTPSPQVKIQLDTTDTNLLPYDELYKLMKEYEQKLINISGYSTQAYSLNNLCNYIERETKGVN